MRERASRQRPLLFLDIDGTLSPYAPQVPPWRNLEGHGFALWVRPELSAWLGELGELFDRVWATTWSHAGANLVGAQLGMPALPAITPGPKAAAILAHAAGRPFAWADDRVNRADRQALAQGTTAPHLIVRTDRDAGLCAADIERLRGFARLVGGGLRPQRS